MKATKATPVPLDEGKGVSGSNPSVQRVVHALAPAAFGGLEKVVQTLATEQRARGIDVRVAVFTEAGSAEPPLAAPLRRNGVPVRIIALPPRAYAGQLRALVDICREERPDVLHTHGYVLDVLSAIRVPQSGVPLVTTVHGFTGGDWKNRTYEWLQTLAYRRFDAVVAVSRLLAGQLAARGVSRERVVTIPNALVAGPMLGRADARASLEIPENCFSIGWVGRASHEKGLDVMVEAFAALADLPVRLTVIGDGPQCPGLRQRAGELGIASLISWRGVVAEASQYMPAFDVLVMSSRTEGTPMALLEAMHARVPVVTSAVGGIPDIVSSAEALLVSADNSSVLAAAIRAVYADRESAARRAVGARARLDAHYSPAQWVDAYARIYAAVQPSVLGART